MTDPRETLEHIRKQADAATEGPWEADTFSWRPHPLPPSEWLGIEATGAVMGEVARIQVNDAQADADAAFIAASRTNVPMLVGTLEKVLKRHAPMPVYVLAEDCEAPDDHQHGSTSDGGDDICWDEPTGEIHCRECRDKWGECVEYPCPTVTDITATIEGINQ